MSSLRRLFIIGFMLLFISNSALAQESPANRSQEARSNSSSAPTITAAFAADRIRFTALGEVDKLRLEVFSAASDLLFDSGFQPGSIRDWQFKNQQGQPLPEGSYLCVVTVKDLSGRLRLKQGKILLQGGQASLQLDEGSSSAAPDNDNALATVADSSRQALTVLAHDGKDGQLVSTSGGLAFRLGNLFAATDKEMMRLTEEGNFGIGLIHPQARLDVDGLIRTSQGILFPDGTIQFSAASKTLGTPSNRSGQKGGGGIQPQATGVGTQNYISKWTDSAGTLGDSMIFELAGKIGVGTTNPSSVLDVAGNINTSTQYNIGTARVLSIAGSNNLFVGSGAGLFNSSSDNVFVGPNAGIINTTGSYNSFFGSTTGFKNTSGFQNTFIGYRAGMNNTTAYYNTFVGSQAGLSNQTGNNNAFFGTIAGVNNTSGGGNAFFGQAAGAVNTTGNSNSFFGLSAGISNTSGDSNAFFGVAAGQFNQTGADNTFIGYLADFNSTNPTGGNNTLLGSRANVNSGVSNATAIGTGAKATASNTVVLGTDQETVIVPGKLEVDSLGVAGNQQLCLNNAKRLAPCSSSLRYKTDLRSFAGGMAIINRLQPVSFTWKDGGLRDLGFGAEEVEKIEPLLVTYNPQGQVEGVKYDRITVALVNAIKEQQAQVEQQRAQLAAQQTQIAELHSAKVENARLKAQLADIFARLEQLEKLRAARK